MKLDEIDQENRIHGTVTKVSINGHDEEEAALKLENENDINSFYLNGADTILYTGSIELANSNVLSMGNAGMVEEFDRNKEWNDPDTSWSNWIYC